MSMPSMWMVPRLDRFEASHPDLDLRVSATARLVDFADDGIDLAVRYGEGRYPGLHVDLLMEEVVTPVCSPMLIQKEGSIIRVEDLAQHTLLHDDGAIIPGSNLVWSNWLAAAGCPGLELKRGPHFSDAHLTVQAAMGGRGIMLGRSVLIAEELRNGSLVAPLDIRLPARLAYYLVCPHEMLNTAKVAAFRDWILKETRNDQTL
mgnify:CR=1 FL=1